MQSLGADVIIYDKQISKKRYRFFWKICLQITGVSQSSLVNTLPITNKTSTQ